jgi:hypothetical protein
MSLHSRSGARRSPHDRRGTVRSSLRSRRRSLVRRPDGGPRPTLPAARRPSALLEELVPVLLEELGASFEAAIDALGARSPCPTLRWRSPRRDPTSRDLTLGMRNEGGRCETRAGQRLAVPPSNHSCNARGGPRAQESCGASRARSVAPRARVLAVPLRTRRTVRPRIARTLTPGTRRRGRVRCSRVASWTMGPCPRPPGAPSERADPPADVPKSARTSAAAARVLRWRCIASQSLRGKNAATAASRVSVRAMSMRTKTSERFYHGTPPGSGDTAPRSAGSALGLGIVQTIAEVHGDAASVISRPGEGARFEITLLSATNRAGREKLAASPEPAHITTPFSRWRRPP